jgi:hypothetical protein
VNSLIAKLIKKNKNIYKLVRLLFIFGRVLDLNFLRLFYVNNYLIKNKSNNITKKKVVLAGIVGLNPDSLIQSVLGLGLKNIGYQIDQIRCNSEMKICFNAKSFHFPDKKEIEKLIEKGQGVACSLCKLKSYEYSSVIGSNDIPLSSLLNAEDYKKIEAIKIELGKNNSIELLREFLKSSRALIVPFGCLAGS